MANNYVAPITLGFTPANGDRIRGTVNGVEVNGEWNNSNGGVILYEGRQQVCSVGIIDGQELIGVESESAPTTDYELHLYRYTPADIVQIPQEYVEGLEDVAENATAAKTAAETAQSTANAAKTAANAAIGADVIKGDYILRTGQPKYVGYGFAILYKDLSGNEKEKAIFYDHGLQFSDSSHRTLLSLDGLELGGSINANTCIVANSNTTSSSPGKITIKHNGVSTSVRSDGVIGCPNNALTIGLIGNESGIILRSPSDVKRIKLTVSDDARPTFTDTSDPTNTWTPGENLPTVTSSDSGKFLRVSETGAWEAEETAIPIQPIIVDAEADMSTGSITISSEDNIQKMNAIDTAYKAGKPCSAYLRYLVNNSYMWCALIAAIGSSDSYNFLFASSSPNHQLRVEPSTNGNWIVADDGPTEN